MARVSDPVRVCVNGRFLARPITGTERYAREIMQHWRHDVRMLAPPTRWARGGRGHVWEQFVLPQKLRPGETLWSPTNTGPLAVRRQVLVLHDLSALEHPEWYAPAFGLWYRLLLPILVRRVRHVVVPSAYVCGRVIARFGLAPGRVSVVPGGVDSSRFSPRARQREGLPERYFLYVGSLQPRKNLGVLFAAWELVRVCYPDVRLLVAGESGAVFGEDGVLNANPSRPGVVMLGYVRDADLPGLYAGARGLVLPSYDEGFGLPVLEAMACGTPVIAANTGALPEVAGEAGVLFDPHKPDELARAMTRLLEEDGLRDTLSRAGLVRATAFSWAYSADRMMRLLR